MCVTDFYNFGDIIRAIRNEPALDDYFLISGDVVSGKEDNWDNYKQSY